MDKKIIGEKMNRKGELTSGQLITIIILIVSFAVILIFFYLFNFKGEVTKESCRNSVLLRGTALSQQVVSLQCQTKDVCLTTTKNCKGAIKDTEVVRIVDKNTLLDELSNLMYDCWWQMGEGKVDYRAAGMGEKESYCAVCNTVKIDDSIKNNQAMKDITLKELFEYLQTKKVPNKEINYLQYIFGFKDIDMVRQSLLVASQNYGTNVDIDNQKIDLANGNLALVTGLTKEGWGKIAAGIGGGATAGAYLGWPGAIIGGIGGGIIGYYSGEREVKYLPPTFFVYNNTQFKELNCKEFTTLA